MGDLFEDVGRWLMEKNWAFGAERKSHTFCFKAVTEEATFPVELEVRKEAPIIVGMVVFVPNAPISVREHMLKLISFVNFDAPMGGLEMKGKNGQVRFRHSITVEGFSMTAELLDNFILQLLKEASSVFPAFRAVMQGDTHLDALSFM
jgi:hypothetical protein